MAKKEVVGGRGYSDWMKGRDFLKTAREYENRGFDTNSKVVHGARTWGKYLIRSARDKGLIREEKKI